VAQAGDDADWEDDVSMDSEDEQFGTDIEFLSVPEYTAVMQEKYSPKTNEIKMVLAVRNDLGMTKGKIGAQCGHATLGGYKQVKRWAQKSAYWREIMTQWSVIGQKKICVKVNSQQEM
jgi:PTH2 family peptidyl-tRNA hydrolase